MSSRNLGSYLDVGVYWSMPLLLLLLFFVQFPVSPDRSSCTYIDGKRGQPVKCSDWFVACRTKEWSNKVIFIWVFPSYLRRLVKNLHTVLSETSHVQMSCTCIYIRAYITIVEQRNALQFVWALRKSTRSKRSSTKNNVYWQHFLRELNKIYISTVYVISDNFWCIHDYILLTCWFDKKNHTEI